ncbi:MAG: hypothetical protein AB7W59_18725 [Acidimicrobiia bacterium]
MAVPVSRRTLVSAGAAAALSPLVFDGVAPAAQTLPATLRTGPLYVLTDPARVFDSRSTPPTSGGGRLLTGGSTGVSFGFTVANASNGLHSPAAVWINLTITETQGAGYLVVRPSDATGEKPLPPTSNVNWSTSGQTLANLTLVAVGFETYIEIHAGGSGSTHLIVDLQGYIPITS